MSRCAEKKFFFCSKLYELSSKAAFLRTKSLLFAQTFPYCYPKQLFSTLHIPFALSLTYCPPKNTAVLLISALNSYAVKPERRTDSNHCRRYPETCSFQHSRLPDERRSLSQKHRIDRRFESSPESRGSQTSGVLFGSFCTTQKARKTSLSQEAPRFCKPRSSLPQ